MSEKKPTPIFFEPDSKMCPGCGKKSYSIGGIHPQCAVTLADAPRKTQLDAEKKARAKEKEDK